MSAISSLRVHADAVHLPAGVPPVAMLFPRWGAPPPHPSDPSTVTYAKLCAQGVPAVAFEDEDRADYLLLPFDWSWTERRPDCREQAERLHARARATGKRLLVFYWNDSSDRLPLDQALVFRTSVDKSAAYGRTEFCMPAWLEDPLTGRRLELRDKSSTPTVGFCGFTEPRSSSHGWRRRAKGVARAICETTGRVPERLARTPLELRRHALERIAKQPKIRSWFVERDRFFGGAANTDTDQWNEARRRQVRAEYVDNITGSDYTLCVRGAGNYSHRYFDTLACGRIPVLVDSGGAIPYDLWVDWRTRGPWVPANRLADLPRAILEFHDRLAPDQFRELQAENRRLYEEYLSPEGFFRNFASHFTSVEPA